MKKRFFGLLAAFLAFTALGVLSACGDKNPPDSTGGGNSTPVGPTENDMDCRVTVKSEGGMSIGDVTVCAYNASGEKVKEVKTTASGVATFFIEEGEYSIRLSNLPLGFYETGRTYTVSPTSPDVNITLGIELVDEEDRVGHIYQVGDVMHDFSVTTFSGKTLNLYDLLEEKDMVFLNFWYSTCVPCLTEMPWMNNAYNDERFAGDFEIIAVHNNMYDLATAQAFVAESEWDFEFSHVALTNLSNYFPITGYPTTVIIDRYGVVAMCETGRLDNQNECTALVAKYLSPDYTQNFGSGSTDGGGIIGPDVPPEVTVPDPTDAELNAALGTNGLDYIISEEEYVWPFIVTEKDGRECIYAPNGPVAGVEAHETSSVLSLTVDVPANYSDYVFTFDYMISSEYQGDYLYVLVDGIIIQKYSGPDFAFNDRGEPYVPSIWQTSYAYVPVRAGEHTLSFVYAKDDGVSDGEDTVYIDNLRFEAIPADGFAYVYRDAATNRIVDEDGYNAEGTTPRFANYATVVFNEADGYYHVHNENGPLLLANIMDTGTNWSKYPLWNYLAVGGYLQYTEANEVRDLKDIIEEFANAENHSDNGYTPVDEYLGTLLQFIAETFGSGYDNEWLEFCCYYDAYNTDQLSNPCAGTTFRYAIKMDSISEVNGTSVATVDIQKLINPRGYKFAFTPTVSGVYSFESDRSVSKNPNEMDPIAWLTSDNFRYDADGAVIFDYEAGLGIDFFFQMRLEAGKTYYLAAAHHDPSFMGDKYNVVITLVSADQETVYEFNHCATQPYFNILDGNGNPTWQSRADGVSYRFDSEGYARVVNPDGSLGSYIYVDMVGDTYFQTMSLQDVIDGKSAEFGNTAFDFSQLAIDTDGTGGADTPVLDENGQPYGDYTDTMKAYLSEALSGDPDSELYGFTKVTKELQQLLRLYTMKVHSEEIFESWQCFCYYYREI